MELYLKHEFANSLVLWSGSHLISEHPFCWLIYIADGYFQLLDLSLYFITDHIWLKIYFTQITNGASPKMTPEHDSNSGSAGYVLMWVLWGEIKFRTFLPPSWITGSCHPSSTVNMFLILSSLHLSFGGGYSRTDYLGFVSKDFIFLKSCGAYTRKKIF